MSIRIWSFQEKRQEALLQGHRDNIRSVAVTYDDKYIISASDDRSIRIWDIGKKLQEAVLQGHTGEVIVWLLLAITMRFLDLVIAA